MTIKPMASACFRFYQELNDFLPARDRQREVRLAFDPPVPVVHVIESLGIPHTEVELILVNGRSVGFDYRLSDRDRVSVYPMFEALDITPLLRVRQRPLRVPRFVADAHLGKLAGYLRMLGFDTLFRPSADDQVLAAVAAEERRILLTRDRALLMHRVVTHGCYVRQQKPREQLVYLLERLDLCRLLRPFSRCMRCNTALQRSAGNPPGELLPPRVRDRQHQFWRCPGCGRVYWRGSHYRQMQAFIATLCGNHSGRIARPEE